MELSENWPNLPSGVDVATLKSLQPHNAHLGPNLQQGRLAQWQGA
jgi:hypothetical protein